MSTGAPPAAFSVRALSSYVSVVVEAPLTRELAIEIGVEATCVADSLGRGRFILLDLRMARYGGPRPIDHELGAAVSGSRLETRAFVALLVSPEDHSHDFVEALLLRAGYLVRLFADEQEAVAWLTA